MATEFSRGIHMTVGMFKELAKSRNWPDNALIDVRYYDFEIQSPDDTDISGVVDWSATGDFENNTHTITLMLMTYDELATRGG